MIFNLFSVSFGNIAFSNYSYVLTPSDMHRFCCLVLLYYQCRYLACFVKTINEVGSFDGRVHGLKQREVLTLTRGTQAMSTGILEKYKRAWKDKNSSSKQLH